MTDRGVVESHRRLRAEAGGLESEGLEDFRLDQIFPGPTGDLFEHRPDGDVAEIRVVKSSSRPARASCPIGECFRRYWVSVSS